MCLRFPAFYLSAGGPASISQRLNCHWAHKGPRSSVCPHRSPLSRLHQASESTRWNTTMTLECSGIYQNIHAVQEERPQAVSREGKSRVPSPLRREIVGKGMRCLEDLNHVQLNTGLWKGRWGRFGGCGFVLQLIMGMDSEVMLRFILFCFPLYFLRNSISENVYLVWTGAK